jgi:hypothetical protein
MAAVRQTLEDRNERRVHFGDTNEIQKKNYKMTIRTCAVGSGAANPLVGDS